MEYESPTTGRPLPAGQYQVRQRLALKHRVRRKYRKKPTVRAKDKFKLFKIVIFSVEVIFNRERYCVELALIM